jgi:hypothetical protein
MSKISIDFTNIFRLYMNYYYDVLTAYLSYT